MTRPPDVDRMVRWATDGAYGIDGIVERLTDGVSLERMDWIREGRVDGAGAFSFVAFKEYSHWKLVGTPFSGGVTPTTWAEPTRSTAGALGQTNPVNNKRLTAFHAWGMSRGFTTFYDRLAHCGGLDGTNTGTQNVNGGSDGTWTRYSGDHVGNQIWIEIYADVGSTARTITCSYKNENGVTHTTEAREFGGTGNLLAGRIIRLPLQAGDKGVSAVISVTIGGGSTGTAGNFGVTVARPIQVAACGTLGPAVGCFLDGTTPHIETDACLSMVGFGTSAADLYFFFEYDFLEDTGGGGEAQVIHRFVDPRIGGAALSTGAVGVWYSTWEMASYPGANTAPGSIAIPTNTEGLYQANASGGRDLWLACWKAHTLAQTASIVLSDRLLHVGGLSGTNTGLVEFASGAVTNVNRDPTAEGLGLGVGNELWVEISQLIGNTPQTLTINYEDADGAAQVATVSIGGGNRRIAGALLPVPLANDRGIKGLVSCQLGGSTGTAGSFSIVVSHRLATNNAAISTGFNHRAIDRGWVKIPTNACLWEAILHGGTITPGNVMHQSMYVFTEN